MRSRWACHRSSMTARAMTRSISHTAASAPMAAVSTTRAPAAAPSVVSTAAVIQAAGNETNPTSTRTVPLETGVLTRRLVSDDQRGRPHVDDRGRRHDAAEDHDQQGDADRGADEPLRVGRGDDVAIREAEAEEDGEVATDRGAHDGLVARCAASEATGQVVPGLERGIGVGGAAERDQRGLLEGQRRLDVGEVRADLAQALVDHGGELGDRVGVRVVGGRRAHLVELDRVSELHQGRGPQRHLVREREAHRHDAQPVGSRRPRAERDASGAGLDRIEARPVVRGPLGEDGDHVAADEGPVAGIEGGLVATRAARVDAADGRTPPRHAGGAIRRAAPSATWPWPRSGGCGPWPR